jgi:ribosomal protein S9
MKEIHQLVTKFRFFRIQVMFPLQILDKLFKFDLTVKVDFGGYSSQAGAIREGLAKCLTAFVSKEDMEILRHGKNMLHCGFFFAIFC